MSVVDEDVVKFSVVGEHIAVFTLNRPKAMNAVNRSLSDRMEQLLKDFEADDNLWVGVLCSSHHKVFSAGADLKAISKNERIMAETGGFGGLTHLTHIQRTKPLIAAVDGLALAGGLELVLACDMLVASRTSAFALPEVKRSLVAAAGGLHRLPRRLPTNIAVEMLLTGDRFPAERAYQLGFVNHLAEPGKSYEVALELAERIVVNAPLAVRESLSLAKGLELASDKDAFISANQSMKRLSTTPDFKEGPKAFIEKRAPRWTGKQSKL